VRDVIRVAGHTITRPRGRASRRLSRPHHGSHRPCVQARGGAVQRIPFVSLNDKSATTPRARYNRARHHQLQFARPASATSIAGLERNPWDWRILLNGRRPDELDVRAFTPSSQQAFLYSELKGAAASLNNGLPMHAGCRPRIFRPTELESETATGRKTKRREDTAEGVVIGRAHHYTRDLSA
jgi:hypothetical protein